MITFWVRVADDLVSRDGPYDTREDAERAAEEWAKALPKAEVWVVEGVEGE